MCALRKMEAPDTSQGIRCKTHQQKVHIGYIEHIALQLLHPEIAFYNHGALLMISCYFKNFATSYIGYTSETTAPQFWNQSYSYEKLDFLWSTWRQLHGPAPLPDTHVTVLPHFLTRLCLYSLQPSDLLQVNFQLTAGQTGRHYHLHFYPLDSLKGTLSRVFHRLCCLLPFPPFLLVITVISIHLGRS